MMMDNFSMMIGIKFTMMNDDGCYLVSEENHITGTIASRCSHLRKLPSPCHNHAAIIFNNVDILTPITLINIIIKLPFLTPALLLYEPSHPQD